MARHRRGYFPSACAKKLLALRPARPEASACKSADRFCPSLQGSRNVSLTECRFFRWRASAPSGKYPVEPCHAAFGGLLSAKLSRQTKTRGFHAGLHIPGMEPPCFLSGQKAVFALFSRRGCPMGRSARPYPTKRCVLVGVGLRICRVPARFHRPCPEMKAKGLKAYGAPVAGPVRPAGSLQVRGEHEAWVEKMRADRGFSFAALWFLIFFLFRAVLFHHASDFVGGLNQFSKAVDEQGSHIRRYAPGQQYREARRHGRMKAAVVDP